MRWNDEQYGRVAGWLDGEPVRLTDAERAAAEQIRRAERRLAAMMDLAVPPASLARARRRMASELARPRRRMLRIGLAAAAVAAAAIVIATIAPRPDQRTRPSGQLDAEAVPVTVLLDVLSQSDRYDEADLLARQIDELAAELSLAAVPVPLDQEIDAVERSIEEFWLADSPAGPPEG